MQKKLRKLFITGFALITVSLLAACSATQGSYHSESAAPSMMRVQDSALGTQWGEGISSPVTTVDLKRVSNKPIDLIEIKYSASKPSGRSVQDIMLANGRIQMSILDQQNNKWPLIQNGKVISLSGKNGELYQLHYQNHSANTYEIVATVDGLDVLTGDAGSISNAGYVLRPYGTLTIQGFRSSQSEVAAFRFSAPSDAYAANTAAGDIKNVGVIGTAVFELDAPRPAHRAPSQNRGQAFPADDANASPYAPAPRYSH